MVRKSDNRLYSAKPLQRGDRLQTSESDVSKRQNLTSKVYPGTVRVKKIIVTVDLRHKSSNESERDYEGIYE